MPLATIEPREGFGGCTPRPTKLMLDAMIMIIPMSRLILVKIGDIALGRISRKMMCPARAPASSAYLTYSSLAREVTRLYVNLTYQGHQAVAMPTAAKK